MEQSLAPGSQTFEQDLFRLYRNDVITLQEALLNADSPTNLSWLINNHEATGNLATEESRTMRQPSSTCRTPTQAALPTRNSPSAWTTPSGRAIARNRRWPGDSSRAATGDATVRLAEQLIACRSVTPEDAGCLAIIAERLAAIGFSCEFIRRGGSQPLGTPRRPQPAVCFAGHTDVVPSGPLDRVAQRPVRAGASADGMLYGRGAADMKARWPLS
jgi:hypothetical protein